MKKESSTISEELSPKVKTPSGYVAPNSSQIDSIGILHNERLAEMVAAYDYTGTNYEAYAESLVKSYPVNTDVWPEGVDQAFAVSSDPMGYIEANGSAIMNSMVSQFQDDLGDLVTYSDVQNYCASQRALIDASALFDQEERDFCFIYLSVVEHSAYFWMSSSVGGSG